MKVEARAMVLAKDILAIVFEAVRNGDDIEQQAYLAVKLHELRFVLADLLEERKGELVS